MRARFEEALGSEPSVIKKFHDIVLLQGVAPLSIIRGLMEEHIEKTRASDEADAEGTGGAAVTASGTTPGAGFFVMGVVTALAAVAAVRLVRRG